MKKLHELMLEAHLRQAPNDLSSVSLELLSLIFVPPSARVTELHELVNKSAGGEGTDQEAQMALVAYVKCVGRGRVLLETRHDKLRDDAVIAAANEIYNMITLGETVWKMLEDNRLKLHRRPFLVSSTPSHLIKRGK